MTRSSSSLFSSKPLLLSKRAFFFGAIVFLLLGLRISIDPSAFKDYAQYLDYLSSIKTDGLWAGGLDLASNFIFYLAGQLFSGREDALTALYLYLLVVFFLFSSYFVLIRKVDWLNFWAFFVLFGPLLAFVTIRATPAYFAFIVAFFLWRDGRVFLAMFFALLSAMFHFSALLLIPVLLASIIFYRPLNTSLPFRRAVWGLYFLLMFVGFYMTIVGPGPLVSGVEVGELLLRYSAYIEEVEPVSGVFHRIYYWGAAAAATSYLMSSRDDWKCKGLIMFASLQFYLVAWSPVLAFRQSIFWVAPILLTLPIAKVVRSRDLRVFGAIVMLVILFYSFFGILEPAFLESL